MSVLCFLFPHGTYLKRVDLPPPPPQNIQSNKKNLKRYLQMPVELLLFLFLVRQVRLQNGGVLVGTLQFCDCSRYHDGISTGASHERGRPLTPSAPHTLGSIHSTYYTEEESHTEDTRKTRQSSLEKQHSGKQSTNNTFSEHGNKK